VDSDTVHYKQAYGVERTGQLVPRKNSPCSIAILHSEVTLFRYALSDPCVLADDGKLAEVGYKFYAGAPLVTSDHFNIGMLAVVDKVPRHYSAEEMNKLRLLAAEVMQEIEFRQETKNSPSQKVVNARLKVIQNRVVSLRSLAP
jgi:GAF domain-containing protein